jgi:cysteinyl-tRNA synthetase
VLISGHYRQSLNFSFDALGAARHALERLDEFQGRLSETAAGATAAAGLPEWAGVAGRRFDEALADDLNIAEALAALFDMVHAGNKAMDAKGVNAGEAAAVSGLLARFDRVLGFLAKPREAVPAEAAALLERRQKARAARDWPEADRVRNELAALGWVIQDTPQGPKLKRK